MFFGNKGQSKVEDSFVVVVGLGGVGSHCAISLARSGVGRLRLIDFDRVSVSSLNRHATATRADVGASKTAVLAAAIQQISPWVKIELFEELFAGVHAPRLLSGDPSFVVDAIDNLPTKLDLLNYCKTNHIPVITACGAGGKCDPTALQTADISKTSEDGLARAVRIGLRARGIRSGIPAVFSTERSAVSLQPLSAEQEASPDDFRPLDDFRVRVVPVIAAVPAAMGQCLAAYVLRALANYTPPTPPL